MLHKYLLILIPLLGVINIDENLIEWSSSRKLTWQDFKGKPNPLSDNAALTNSTITADFGYSNKGLKHTIKCVFNKSLSWGRIKNDYILNHEQGHFDLAEIHARLLHKALLAYTFNSKKVGEDVNRIYNDVMKEHVSAQSLYDSETNHSIDTARQMQWDKKIASQLEGLEKFREYK
jgi:predicted secreted Zn-dependent protease